MYKISESLFFLQQLKESSCMTKGEKSNISQCPSALVVGEGTLSLSFKLQDSDCVRYPVGAHKTSLRNKLPSTFLPALTLLFKGYVRSRRKLSSIRFPVQCKERCFYSNHERQNVDTAESNASLHEIQKSFLPTFLPKRKWKVLWWRARYWEGVRVFQNECSSWRHGVS